MEQEYSWPIEPKYKVTEHDILKMWLHTASMCP